MKRFLFLLIFPFVLSAQQPMTPEQIQGQLDQAQAQFDHALKLFNPWYTGPLITPSASMVPPGSAMYQPYIYFTDNYAVFDEDRHSVSAPNQFTLSTLPVLLQIGVTKSVDVTLIMGAQGSWSQGKSGGGFQDILATLGFLMQRQSLYVPQVKFSLTQSFPTGTYKNLNTNGLALSSTGAGAWQTTFTLTIAKVILWSTLHPMNTRVSFGYTISTPVRVTNFNAYGGGFGTHGTAHPGNILACDLGLEYSFNQAWAFALDVVYKATNRNKFNGYPGLTAASLPASVGSGYSDQLSLAPAIEYNFNENMGVLAGIWFTVYGRSAPNFASGVFTWYWEFP